VAYWWVNQNQTYKHEIKGFLWSPKFSAGGKRNQFYDNMMLVEPGDVVFSFKDTKIMAVGIAVSRVQSSPKPNFGKAGTNWHDDGWLVEVEFTELNNTIRPKDHIALLAPHLPPKYSPLQANGNGIQSVYLASVPDSMAAVMVQLIGPEYEAILSSVPPQSLNEAAADGVEQQLLMRLDISETEKEQLVKSRRGQGLFKSNVRIVEDRCRVTGVTQLSMLRASHIKPWKVADNTERIDGFNGLLLAPHVDHLFDKGYISFESTGEMLLSPKLEVDILDHWHIPEVLNVGAFNPEQGHYLEHHQIQVFQAIA